MTLADQPSRARTGPAEPDLAVAIVGMGPRGLSVLERLVVRLARVNGPGRPVCVYTVDPGEMGAGRIWRTDQPEWLLMNTPAGEVSLYSHGPDGGPWRAGAGPSLHEWLCARTEGPAPSPNGYAPRRVYGEYLRAVYRSIVGALPPGVTVRAVTGRASSLCRAADGRYHLVAGGRRIAVDKAVITTGHSRPTAGESDRDLLDFASRHPGTGYVRGDSAADMDLSGIEPGEPVGVLGLGLTFYDVTALLTVGRGGRFRADRDGRLRYEPSGREPRLYASSRSGMPLRARGRNQKDAHYRYRPQVFTPQALARARAEALAGGGSVRLRFREHVLPLILGEVEHVYWCTAVRQRDGGRAARVFARRHLAAGGDKAAVRALLDEYGLAGLEPPDLERMARPFDGERFAGPVSFRERLLGVLRADLADAEAGNVDGPLKAALDILRDVRGVVREAVEFSGLHPESHRDDFLGWFNPINTMLSAGPPAVRVAEAIALVEAGVLTVVGPGVRIGADEDRGRFTLVSPQVPGSRVAVRVLVDARIPGPDVVRDPSPLIRQLLADGLATAHVNIDPRDGARFTTGALAVTRAPYRLVDAAGRGSRDLYALGVPTEALRWFTQIGNGRPGPLAAFHSDADAIAADLLAG